MYPRWSRLILIASLALLVGQAATGEEPAARGTRAPEKDKPARADHYGDPLPAKALAHIGTTRFWHSGRVHCVAFTADGRVLGTGGADEAVRFWDLASGKELRSFSVTEDGAHTLAFSPSGRLLASGGGYHDHDVRLWEAATGKLLHRLKGHPSAVHILAFSADGKTLASAGGGKSIRLWDTGTGKLRRALTVPDELLSALALSPDGSTLASGQLFNPAVRLWDVMTGKQRRSWQAHARGAHCLAFAPNGRALVSGGEDGVRIWDPATGKELRALEDHKSYIMAVAFSPSGKTFASAGDEGTIRLWDMPTSKKLRSFRRPGRPHLLAFSPDGKLLASAGSKVTVWEVATGKEWRHAAGHKEGICHIAVSPNGRILASRGTDATVRLWDLATGRELHCFDLMEPGTLGSVIFSPDGKTLFWQDNAKLCSVDARTGKELPPLDARQLGGCLAFSPDGKLLATENEDHTIRLWDRASGKVIRQFRGHRDSVSAVVFSPDGKLLASASGSTPNTDSTARIWDAATGKELHCLKEHEDWLTSVAFSPDGKLLVTGSSDHTARIWDVATGKDLHRLAGHKGQVLAVAFSPDGRTVASASGGWECAVRIWEVATGKERCHWRGHKDTIRSLAFCPDGRVLVSGSDDTTCLLWDVTDSLGARGRQTAEPAPEEWLAWWEALAGQDAPRAYQAVCALVHNPRGAIPWLRARLPPAPKDRPERIARLLADLDSDQFDLREKATRELEQLEEVVLPALQRALEGRPSAEARRRMGLLLERLRQPAPSGQRLRVLRALEVLEQMGTPDARQTLQNLAQGAPEARLTQEAKASLERLKGRAVTP
jgi:WD40 repeat protein